MSQPGDLFTAVDPKRRALLVAQQVLDAIQQGRLQPGDQLPAEREVADRTGVSRPSVREAFSALQLIGILETRHGQGTFVSRRRESNSSAATALLELYETPEIAESLEARRVVEKAVAYLAVERVTTDGLSAMSAALDQMVAAGLAADFPSANEANQAFHRALANLAVNPTLVSINDTLAASMSSRLAVELRGLRYWGDPGVIDAVLRTHRQILEAVRQRDVEALHRAIDDHYDQIEQSL